ncbi:1835_t:CDS:1, partial [Dentiscutata heterogama]
ETDTFVSRNSIKKVAKSSTENKENEFLLECQLTHKVSNSKNQTNKELRKPLVNKPNAKSARNSKIYTAKEPLSKKENIEIESLLSQILSRLKNLEIKQEQRINNTGGETPNRS